MQNTLKAVNEKKSLPYNIGVCCGLAEYDASHKINMDQLIAIADERMYQKKNSK